MNAYISYYILLKIFNNTKKFFNNNANIIFCFPFDFQFKSSILTYLI